MILVYEMNIDPSIEYNLVKMNIGDRVTITVKKILALAPAEEKLRYVVTAENSGYYLVYIDYNNVMDNYRMSTLALLLDLTRDGKVHSHLPREGKFQLDLRVGDEVDRFKIDRLLF